MSWPTPGRFCTSELKRKPPHEVCAVCDGPSDCYGTFDDGTGLCRGCAESAPSERFPRLAK